MREKRAVFCATLAEAEEDDDDEGGGTRELGRAGAEDEGSRKEGTDRELGPDEGASDDEEDDEEEEELGASSCK